MKALRLAFVLALLITALVVVPGGRSSSPTIASTSRPATIPAAALPAISQAIGADDDTYAFERDGNVFRARNGGHDLEATFDLNSVSFSRAGQQAELRLTGYGRDQVTAVTAAGVTVDANRLAFSRGSVSEWYVNGPVGLEQGFTLSEKPAGFGPLAIAMAVKGLAVVDQDRRGLSFTNGLRYSGLTAFDAAGRELPAWIEAGAGGFSLRVDDRDARYPVLVDPWVQVAKLTASDSVMTDQFAGARFFGGSIAISGDTIVVGAEHSHNSQGGAYVFVKPATGWQNATENARLIQSDPGSGVGASGDRFGNGVAISGDTIAVGAPGSTVGGNTLRGAVYVFVKPLPGWAGTLTETAKLIASDGAFADQLGWRVGISGDTIVAGAPGAAVGSAPNAGALYVFVRPGGGWVNGTQTAKLTASDPAGPTALGESVAIDALTIVAGAPGTTIGSNSAQGAIYLFVKPVGPWANATETAKLTASDGAEDDDLGNSVGISGDAVIGGANTKSRFGDGEPNGEAYIWVKPGAAWVNMTETARLLPSDPGDFDEFGISVAIEGGTAVVGAYTDDIGSNGSQGSAYIFVKPASGWAGTLNETQKITSSDGGPGDIFGTSVSISNGIIAVGAATDTVQDNGICSVPGPAACGQGSAYVFGPTATTPAPGATPTMTPTPGPAPATPTPFPTPLPTPHPNLSAPLGQVIPLLGRTPVPPAVTVPQVSVPILPPNTGDAGLASESTGHGWLLVAVSAAIATAAATLRLSWSRRRQVGRR